MLSADRTFVDGLRDALAGMHRVWRADDVAHAGELMIAAGNPVFLIDASLAACDTREVVSRVHEQFPELSIVVAGNRDHEAQFAPLVSSGVVFRCLDPRASPEAIRHLVDSTQPSARPRTYLPVDAPRKSLFAALAGKRPTFKFPKFKLPKVRVDRARMRRWSRWGLRAATLLLAAWVLWQWQPWGYVDGMIASLKPAPPAPVVVDNGAKLQKLLDDAGYALTRGRLVDPPGRNALELYRAALALDPGNETARRGIDNVADMLLAEAERALQAHDMPRLASAVDAARSARPDHPRLEFYSLQLKRARERLRAPE